MGMEEVIDKIQERFDVVKKLLQIPREF